MLSLALNALSLPHNFKDRSTVLTSPQATCPDGCAAQATVHAMAIRCAFVYSRMAL